MTPGDHAHMLAVLMPRGPALAQVVLENFVGGKELPKECQEPDSKSNVLKRCRHAPGQQRAPACFIPLRLRVAEPGEHKNTALPDTGQTLKRR